MKLIIALIGLVYIPHELHGLPQLLRRSSRDDKFCYTPENDVGECTPSTQCQHAIEMFKTAQRSVARQYLQAAQTGCKNLPFSRDPMICCEVSNEITSPNPYIPLGSTTQLTVIADPSTSPLPVIDFVFPTSPAIAIESTTQTPPEVTTTQVTSTRAPSTNSAPFTSTTTSEGLQGSETCRGPDLIYGICIPLENCVTLKTRLQENPSDVTLVNMLKISNQICKSALSESGVCCPLENQEQFELKDIFPENRNDYPTSLPSMEDGCGYVKTQHKKIVGGVDSKIGAWPWIALIGYNDGVAGSSFKCGGALITSRHVLTAAHCIRSDITFVRLGEHDLSTDTETDHIDIPVTKVLRHANYRRYDGHSDIAMLYLDRNVKFSPKITPICLPLSSELQTKSYVNKYPFVAGWGKTIEDGKSANVLQELVIQVFENSVCKDSYMKQNKYLSEQQFDDAVICAGDLAGGKDTCQGDSGGPLMTTEPFKNQLRYHLLGVVSYSIGCARPDVPGAYTRVAHFMDWIEKSVAATPYL